MFKKKFERNAIHFFKFVLILSFKILIFDENRINYAYPRLHSAIRDEKPPATIVIAIEHNFEFELGKMPPDVLTERSTNNDAINYPLI